MPAHPRPLTDRTGGIRLIMRLRRNFLSAWPGYFYSGHNRTVRIFGRQVVLVNRPEDVKHVLATRHQNYERKSPQMRRSLEFLLGDGLVISDGETWRRRRPLVADIMHKSRVPRFGGVMEQITGGFVRRWGALPPVTVLDAPTEMGALAAGIISRAVFGNDLSPADTHDIVDGLTRYQELVDTVNVGYFMGLNEGLRQFRSPRIRREVKRIHRVIDRVVSDHLEGRGDDRSMVDLLIKRQTRSPELGLDRDALRNEAATLFLAGHETTAATLSWAFYLLANAPWAEKRVLAEIAAVCGDRAPTVADVPQLEYTRAVIDETLRLYPPIPILARQAREADTVGSIAVEPAALVLVVPWLLHRSKDFWKRPNHFKPERFLGDKRPIPYSYIPFAAGPRICAGLAFGMTESILCLAILAQSFRVRVPEGTKVEPVQRLTLKPRGGMPIVVERR